MPIYICNNVFNFGIEWLEKRSKAIYYTFCTRQSRSVNNWFDSYLLYFGCNI